MSKAEILRELPKLSPAERDEIRLRLAEIDGGRWIETVEPLSIAEKAILEERLLRYQKDPDTGATWEEVESRIRKRMAE